MKDWMNPFQRSHVLLHHLCYVLVVLLLAGCVAAPAGVAPVETATVPAAAADTPTPTPTATPLPAVEVPVDAATPHRVAFVQEGNVWLAQAGAEAVPLTQEGGVEQVRISADGTIVAFSRGGELWVVDADGSDERRLVSTDLLAQAGPEGEAATLYRFDWLPGTHILLFNTQKVQEMGLALNDDLHQVDVETGTHQRLLPPGQGGEFYPSPDGEQIAIVTPEAIGLVNADGSDYRAGLVTYEPIVTYSEYRYYATPEWAADSSAFAVAIPPADPLAQPPGETVVWRVPANGDGAQVIGSIQSSPFHNTFAFSPDLSYLAYLSPVSPTDGAQSPPSPDLAVVDLTTGEEIARFPEVTDVYGWSPDGRLLAFLRGAERPQAEIAKLDGDSWPVDNTADAAIDVRWLTSDQYLFLRQSGEGWDLVLGRVEGENQALASVAGMPPAFDSSRPAPVSVATPETPAEDGGAPHEVARRILEQLEEPIPAPPGWQVTLCEGMAPMLCVQADDFTTAVELAAFPMPTLPDFQAILAEHGLDVATLDTASASYRRAAEAVLRDFVADHLDVIEADRRTTFGETVDFEPLAIESVDFGGLPGVRYGFVLTGADGQVMERVVAFAAFDKEYLYVINGVYDPAYVPSFPSEEALLTFEPFLRQIVTRLPLAD